MFGIFFRIFDYLTILVVGICIGVIGSQYFEKISFSWRDRGVDMKNIYEKSIGKLIATRKLSLRDNMEVTFEEQGLKDEEKVEINQTPKIIVKRKKSSIKNMLSTLGNIDSKLTEFVEQDNSNKESLNGSVIKTN